MRGPSSSQSSTPSPYEASTGSGCRPSTTTCIAHTRVFLTSQFGMQKLALAAGFTLEGHERESWLVYGRFHDRKCYSLLASEYQPPAL